MFEPSRLDLMINPGGFVAEFLDVLDIGAGIDQRTAVGPGFAA